jgi:hypothetical protein
LTPRHQDLGNSTLARAHARRRWVDASSGKLATLASLPRWSLINVAIALALISLSAGEGYSQEPALPPEGSIPVSERPAAYSHDDMAPTARAVRTDAPITVDGVLDEAVWMTAPEITGLLQTVPAEAEPVTEKTEVRILYDDDNVYVGAWLWDEGEVQARLRRRDQGTPDADYFIVIFDSYHDHRTAYRFAVSAAGNHSDEIMTIGRSQGGRGGGFGDRSWDPVLDVRTSITEDGWFAEWRIPFSQLRYRADEVQTWGLQMERKLRLKAEDTMWAFTPRSEPAVVARYGHLEGIEGIGVGKRLELLPFVSARAERLQIPRSEAADFDNPFQSGSEYIGNAGLDLKYRLGTNLTLNAAVNPDFGQVELDPAVINLTAFETRFDEKRPFFVEGAETFRFGDSGGRQSGTDTQLLYSRRIGRTPQGLVPGTAAYSDVPGQTTILGAAKLTGKTANGWSLGLIEAVTDRVTAQWVDPAGANGNTEVEPRSNYLAARMRRDIRQGAGSFGVIATSVHRDLRSEVLQSRLRSSAYALGMDTRIEARSLKWRLNGNLSASKVNGDADAISRTQQSSARYMDRPDATHMEFDPNARSLGGLYGRLDLAKQTGTWQGNLGVTGITPGYEVNDLGFQGAADRVEVTSDFGYRQPTVGDHFRTLNVTGSATNTFNFGGEAVVSDVGLSIHSEHASFNRINASVTRRFEVWNDRLTRGGPLSLQPASYSGDIRVNTDRRGRVQFRGGFRFDEDDGGGRSRGGDLGVLFQFLEIYEVDVGANVSRDRIAAQYVATVADPAASRTFGSRYVFAPLDQTTVSIDTRFNVTFSPALTFELYAQPLMASGNYRGLMELAAPRTFDFLRYGEDVGTVRRTDNDGFAIDPEDGGEPFVLSDPDFDLRSLLGSAVLRWEWRPGSTLFLVWQQTRSERLERMAGGRFDDGVGDFRLGRDARELFGLKPDNVFAVKVTYWLNP